MKNFKLGTVEFPVNTRKGEKFEPYIPDNPTYVQDGGKDDFAQNILLGVQKNLPVLLIGPTGCGKTATIKWLAGRTGSAYRRIQLNGSTNIDNFVGRWLINSEGTYWVDGILTDAMRHGHWLVLDELNAALPEILFVLHSIMDDDKMLILDEKDGEIVRCHPDFRIFATINPWEDYAGTKELNRALVDRFPIVLNVEYPEKKLEKKIVLAHTDIEADFGKTVGGRKPIVERMVEFANNIRKKVEGDQMIFNCSTRQLIHWGKLISALGVKRAAGIAIVSKADKEDRKKILDEISKLFRDDEDIPMAKFKELEAKKKTEGEIIEEPIDDEVLESEEVSEEAVF